MCEIESSPCGEKEVCIPNYQDNSAKCKCQDGYVGKPCGMYPKTKVQTLQSLIAIRNITEPSINLTLKSVSMRKPGRR